MKLFYYSDGSKVLVNLAGDDFLATPGEALALEAELVFCWHKEAAGYLLGAWKNLGVVIVESTVQEFVDKGGIFSQAADFYESQYKLELQKN